MAFWPTNTKFKMKSNPPITLGDGVNKSTTPFEIKPSEAWESNNVSSRNYPALSTRPGRQNAFTSITKPNALGVYNNQFLHIVDGTTWKRWDGYQWITVTTVADTSGKFVEFVTETYRYMVYFNGTDRKAWNGSSVTELTGAPQTKLICVDDFRIYALKDGMVYCSAEADITQWNKALDSNKILFTDAQGPGSGIVAFNDVVMCFTEQSSHPVYGNDPYDQETGDAMDDGCISDRTIIKHGGKFYFLDYGAFKMSLTGLAKEVSQKVRPYLEKINLAVKEKCCAGKHGRYIYLAIPYDGATENNLVLEYDTETGNWYTFDFNVVSFSNIGDALYAVDSNGKLWQMNTGTTIQGSIISWKHRTGVIHSGIDKLVVSKLKMVIDLPLSSTFTLSASQTADQEDFFTLYTLKGKSGIQTTTIIVPLYKLQNIDYYRLEFSGTGPCTIHYYAVEGRVKG